MTHLVRRTSAALNADQFVVGPECSIHQEEIARIQQLECFHPYVLHAGKEGRLLVLCASDEPNHRAALLQLTPASILYVIWVIPTGCDYHQIHSTNRRLSAGCNLIPCALVRLLLQHSEKRIALTNDLAHRSRRVEFKRLLLPQMQKPNNAVNVSACENGARNRRLAVAALDCE